MSDDSVDQIQARAVRGASWTIAAGIVSRVLGLFGSLAITYYLDPEVVGEVGVALVLTLTASIGTTFGLGNYLVAKPDEGRETAWHATVFHVVSGFLALAVVIVFARPLAAAFRAPHAAVFVLGMAMATALDRIAYVPERMVIRAMNFRRIAFARAMPDIAYTITSLAFAMVGLGGFAIVLANIVRAAYRTSIYVASAKREEWLTPHRFNAPICRRMFRFGVPLWLSSLAEMVSSRWDNLIVGYLHGPRVMGQYQMAYNLADVPADQIGEQVAEVLLPTFAQLPLEDRKRALVSSTGALAFVVFPVAIGFGAVGPTLIALVMRPAWAGVAPMLMILCVLSVLRPLTWQMTSYLLASDRPRVHMACSFAKALVLVPTLLTVGRLGPLWACVAAGSGFAAHLLLAQWSVAREDGIPMRVQLGRCLPPLLACVPMVLAVVAVRRVIAPFAPGFRLPVEIVAGIVGYVLGAFALAPKLTREFLDLLRAARARRRSSTRARASEKS